MNSWEAEVLKRLRATAVKASGAMWDAKLDLIKDPFRIECKETDTETYRVNHRVWKTVWDYAVHAGQSPAMAIRVRHMEFAVFDANDWRVMDLPTAGSFGKKQVIALKEEVATSLGNGAMFCELYKIGLADKPIIVAPFTMFERMIAHGIEEKLKRQ